MKSSLKCKLFSNNKTKLDKTKQKQNLTKVNKTKTKPDKSKQNKTRQKNKTNRCSITIAPVAIKANQKQPVAI